MVSVSVTPLMLTLSPTASVSRLNPQLMNSEIRCNWPLRICSESILRELWILVIVSFNSVMSPRYWWVCDTDGSAILMGPWYGWVRDTDGSTIWMGPWYWWVRDTESLPSPLIQMWSPWTLITLQLFYYCAWAVFIPFFDCLAYFHYAGLQTWTNNPPGVCLPNSDI